MCWKQLLCLVFQLTEELGWCKMKLYEVSDWNKRMEAEQIARVLANPRSMREIKNPSEAVQLAAVNQYGWNIIYNDNPIERVAMIALRSPGFIEEQDWYERFVRSYFANNTLLMKKWLRYGENMRNQK